MKPQKRNRQPPNSLRSGAEKKATSKRKRPNVSNVHSDPERPMAPRGNQNIIASGSHSTQVMVNASGDEIIAPNQNLSDRAELDPVTVAIPGPSSSRVPMSSTESLRPESHDVATTIHRRAADNGSSIVSQVGMVPSIQDSHALQTVSTTSRQGTYSNAKPTMEILDVEVEKLVHFSMAKNTWKTYKTALESLAKFSKEYDLNVSWPIQIDVLTRFIAYLSYSGLTSSTINTYLSGISHKHKLLGVTDTTCTFIVSKIPFVKQTQGPSDDLHIFTSADNTKLIGNCTTDVTFTPPPGSTGKYRFCFNIFLPNIPGETRCFYVIYMEYTPAPIRHEHFPLGCTDYEDINFSCRNWNNSIGICRTTYGPVHTIARHRCPRFCSLCQSSIGAPQSQLLPTIASGTCGDILGNDCLTINITNICRNTFGQKYCAKHCNQCKESVGLLPDIGSLFGRK
ncbi:unnamed protein product [Mytilus edulis]|uniref:ShKT domain-containing protein n=1 Tax=Mytilus edulis TaxID=6550 RepID=A0A8S3PX72_MYTED|nr:unnamed protein product [Mytilus edulis]